MTLSESYNWVRQRPRLLMAGCDAIAEVMKAVDIFICKFPTFSDENKCQHFSASNDLISLFSNQK